jgi:hypothetical protein
MSEELGHAEAPTNFTRRGGRKGLLAFYISMGVVALLFVGFCFAWTPLRVWYWEREVRRSPPWIFSPGQSGQTPVIEFPRTRAARALADLGPSSAAAFRRLVRARNYDPNGYVLGVLNRPDDSWALPMLMETAKRDDPALAAHAIYAVQDITGKSFFPSVKSTGDAISDIPLGGAAWSRETVEPARTKLLKWWTREGKAKYGSGK